MEKGSCCRTASSRPSPRLPAEDAGIVWTVWFGSCSCKTAGVWVSESIITSNCAMYVHVSCRTAVTSERPATFHTKNETRCSLRCCWLAAPYCEGAREEGSVGPGPGGGEAVVPPLVCPQCQPWQHLHCQTRQQQQQRQQLGQQH